jgi:type I restriction enzyme S subunit
MLNGLLSGWRTVRLKWLLTALESGRRKISDNDNSEGGVLSIGGEHIGWQGEWLLDSPRYISREFFETMSSGRIQQEDVLLVKDGATIGKVAIATSLPAVEAAVNEHVFLLRFSLHNHPKYYFYYIQSSIAQDQIQLEVRGSAQPGLNSEFRNSVFAPQPPREQQCAIAKYLDRETAKIDALVEKKERLIELLWEKRTALITHTVTQGLDSNVPMKDSRIEWLGQIPSHWEIVRLRRILTVVEQGWSPLAEDRKAAEDEWGVIKLSAIKAGRFIQDEHKTLPLGVEHRPSLEIRAGDILMTRGNTPQLVGDVCLVREARSQLMVSDLVYRLMFDRSLIEARFLTYWLLSRAGRLPDRGRCKRI